MSLCLRHAFIVKYKIGLPAILWYCFGISLAVRVPRPAATIRAVIVFIRLL